MSDDLHTTVRVDTASDPTALLKLEAQLDRIAGKIAKINADPTRKASVADTAGIKAVVERMSLGAQFAKQRQKDERTFDRLRSWTESKTIADFRRRFASNSALAQQRMSAVKAVAAEADKAARAELKSIAQVEREKTAALRKTIGLDIYRFGLRDRYLKQEARERDRARREIFGVGRQASNRSMSGVGRVATPGAVVAGATAALATGITRSIVSAARSLDSAATTAAIHAFSEDGVKSALQKAWGLRKESISAGIGLGLKPSQYLGGITEAAQAGIPEKDQKKTAELGAKYAKLMGTSLPETIDDAGHAIYALRGKGYIQDADGIRKFFNVTAGLAGQTAASRAEMMAFARSGISAGTQIGMTPEGALAFGAAGTSAGAGGRQTGRMLNAMVTEMAEWTLQERDVRRKGKKSAEDKIFLDAPRMLGYAGGYQGMEQARKANPDDFIFDLISRFKRIQDPGKRMQVKQGMVGKEFGQFFATLVEAETLNKDALTLARKLSSQKENTDYLTTSWSKWTTSIEFFMDQISATVDAFKAEMGEAFKPFIGEFRDYITRSRLSFDNLKAALGAGLRGLIEGLGGKGGSLTELLRSWFGDAGKLSLDGEKIRQFMVGVGSGFKSVGESIASFARAFGGNTSDPEKLGRWTAEFVGWSAALKAAEPGLGILRGFADIVLSVAGAVTVLKGVKSLAGRTAAGPGGRVAVGAGAAEAAGIGLGAAAAFGSVFTGLSKRDQDKLTGRLGKWALDREAAQPPTTWVDPPGARELRESQDRLRRAVEDGARVQRQSYEAGDDIRSLIHRAAYGDDAADKIREATAGLRLAALQAGGGLTSAAVARAAGVGAAGSAMGAAGIPYTPGAGGSAIYGNTPGKAFSIPGVGSRFGVGGDTASPDQKSGGSRSWRNNNPGNIKAGTFATRMGATGRDDKGFARFPSYEVGRRAQESLLFGSDAYKGLTIGQAIARYAPGSDGNDPAGYAAAMARAAGVAVGTRLADLNPDQRRRFLDAQQAREGWQSGSGPMSSKGGYAGQLTTDGPIRANLMHGQFGGVNERQVKMSTASGLSARVHEEAAPSFKGFIQELEAQGYKIRSFGGQNTRAIRGGSGWSQHAYGNAIDLNPGNNPLGKTITDLPGNTRDLAKKYGLIWGMDWKGRKDPMHFEWNGTRPWLNDKQLANKAHETLGGKPGTFTGGQDVGDGIKGTGWHKADAGDLAKQSPAERLASQAPPRPQASGGGGGSGGAVHAPITIHNNGDAEHTANQVQRRIQDTKNYLTHDLSFESI